MSRNPIPTRTVTLREAEAGPIEADFFQAPHPGPRPAVLWLHGGALICGSRKMFPEDQRQFYNNRGWDVFVPDYRLAPEASMDEILDDVRAAFAWLRGGEARSLGVDGDRVAAVGMSAGGYLALLCGLHVAPRPRAIVSLYGYGDVCAAWYSEPDPGYCREAHIPEAEARQLEPEGRSATRSRFYVYCRQQGRWPQEVCRLDPVSQREQFRPWCPAWGVPADYPPTMLLHGTKDGDVPHSQSEQMAAALKAAGIPHELLILEGRPHGFDYSPGGVEAAENREAYRRVEGFLAGWV